jgi:hypothetical protein
MKKLIRKLDQTTFNTAASGATLGLAGGVVAGNSLRKNRIGALTGLAVGTGIGLASKRKPQQS